MVTLLRRLLAAILLAASMPLQAASLNGIDVGEITRTSKSFQQPAAVQPGEVLLIPAGLRDIARDVLSDSETLSGFFADFGYTYIGPVGSDAALVSARANTAKNRAFEAVRLLPEHRVAAGVRTSASAKGEGEVHLVVYTTQGRRVSQLAASESAAHTTKLLSRRTHDRVGLRIDKASLRQCLEALSRDPSVFSIQLGSGARLLNSTARRIVQSATVDSGGEALWARGIRGEGQVVAVLDTGADPYNCYLSESDGSFPPVRLGTDPAAGDPSRRKIIVYDMLWSNDDPADGFPAYESQGHGTAVSGNALGSKVTNGDEFSNADTVYNGVAPAAKLVVQDAGFAADNCSDLPALGCPVIDLTAILDQAVAQGASIHNNSWGDRENFMPQNTYTAACVDMDDATWRNPGFLIVCAAGNQGSGNDTVGSPSVAKNVLSVAGTENPDFNSIISFSSTGWAEDGRIKPDLAAPASTITSRWNPGAIGLHCTTAPIAGTSMASPITAGAAALVRQYFSEGWYPSGAPDIDDEFTPSAALVKATLVNGASPVTGEPAPPSRRQGWGRVHLENGLHFAGEDQKLLAVDEWNHFQSSADDVYTVTLEVSDVPAQLPLSVTLVYTDYPATAGASPALVNDLDLEVEAETGTVYLGNNLDSTTGLSQTGGTSDAINNVEVVRLPGESGLYTIRIAPQTVLESGQGFALAITGNVMQHANSSMDGWMLF